MPDVCVADAPQRHRFEATVDGNPAGYAVYHDQGGVRLFAHTEVAAEYGGHGVASALIREALEQTRSAGLHIEPVCPFVRAFLDRHPRYQDLVVRP